LFQHFRAEGFNVKLDGGGDVGHCLVVTITLSDDDSFESDGVGDVAIGMLFTDDFYMFSR